MRHIGSASYRKYLIISTDENDTYSSFSGSQILGNNGTQPHRKAVSSNLRYEGYIPSVAPPLVHVHRPGTKPVFPALS